MRSHFVAYLSLLILPIAGCNLYFSGNPDPDPCTATPDWGSGGDRAQPPSLRNPETGACESFGWNGPYPCDSVCGGPCVDYGGDSSNPSPTTPPQDPDEDEGPTGEQADPAPMPTWGYCDSFCTGLDEQTCLATEDCRGIYSADAFGGTGEFFECWQTDFSEPPLVQGCEGLDAYTCSQLDACVAVHEVLCSDTGSDEPGLIPPPCEIGNFLSCHSEVEPDGCYSDNECGPGFSCNAAEVCLPPPSGNGSPCPPDGSDGCDVPAVCYGYCVVDTDPGECDGDVFCDALPPQCEAGTTPGIADGCWTGACIDLASCPQASCDEIMGESMCIARDDCSPYYVGVDCSCTPDGCDCAEWNFESCGGGAPDAP